MRAITDKLIEPGPGSLQEKLDEFRTFALGRLTKLRRLLVAPEAIHEARALLAERVGKLTLERVTGGQQHLPREWQNWQSQSGPPIRKKFQDTPVRARNLATIRPTRQRIQPRPE